MEPERTTALVPSSDIFNGRAHFTKGFISYFSSAFSCFFCRCFVAMETQTTQNKLDYGVVLC